MIHSLHDTTQDQNTDFNIQFPKDSLSDMKKGIMINGSEITYGGQKIDLKNFKGTIRIKRTTKKYECHEKVTTQKVKRSQMGQNQSKRPNLLPGSSCQPSQQKCLCEDKEIECTVDKSKPTCFVSVRLFKGDVIKGKFNTNQTVGDIYSMVKKYTRNYNFVLLEGFPPKPLTDYKKTIFQLRLQNSVLTQRMN